MSMNVYARKRLKELDQEASGGAPRPADPPAPPRANPNAPLSPSAQAMKDRAEKNRLERERRRNAKPRPKAKIENPFGMKPPTKG